ncbi:uncharacterized protein LOC134232241 [Saccostrea cucullata]|uniref:uncharacterized protein LOC134232241 n=1 Tax=Saccostrea cuccullata TaxID=36930 RepID=UPI002ED26B9C
MCDHVTGSCVGGCAAGWINDTCDTECSTGWYGKDCSQRCSSNCITPFMCDRVTGACVGGCAIGWVNDTCDTVDMAYCVDWAPYDVSVVYHNLTWRREETNNIVRYDPAVNLMCSFTTKPDENLFYDVSWFIDGSNVFNQTVDVSSNYTAVLSAYDILEFNRKIGSDIHCNVGAKRMKVNIPSCRTKVGNRFFAGIRIKNPNIVLERKGSENIELEMTIPFASESLFINGVLQPVSDLNIHLAFETGVSSTYGGGGSSNHCEVKIKSFGYHEKHKYENGEWRQNTFFPVHSQDTDGYVINSQMILHLKTGGTNGVGSKIFEHVSLPDILIRVHDTNQLWKGRSCGVYADPHMYTFDGVSYECQTSGEFINYRNQAYLQWIQSKHHLCFARYNGPWCVCAVAARAGRDVFIMDLCGDNGVINFELCEDNSLKVTKIYDMHYKQTTSGLEVDFTKPTVHDRPQQTPSGLKV